MYPIGMQTLAKYLADIYVGALASAGVEHFDTNKLERLVTSAVFFASCFYYRDLTDGEYAIFEATFRQKIARELAKPLHRRFVTVFHVEQGEGK